MSGYKSTGRSIQVLILSQQTSILSNAASFPAVNVPASSTARWFRSSTEFVLQTLRVTNEEGALVMEYNRGQPIIRSLSHRTND